MLLNKNLIKLHLTVFIWGFTAILGQLITKSALILVWYRLMIACIALAIYLGMKKMSFQVAWTSLIRYIGIGILVAVHWVIFYQSIKVSKISVALVALSSITLFTGIFDPLLNRRKLSGLDILIGLGIVSGIWLIFNFESQYRWGTLLGLMAALMASLFTIFNSWQVKKNNSVIVSFYELFSGFVFLSLYLYFSKNLKMENLKLGSNDLLYLLILGVVCTALAYVMAFSVMRTISPFTVNLITSLEPVYGIVLALLFFGKTEALKLGFYLGALIILGSVIMHPILQKKWFNMIPSKKEINSESIS